eukprot:TRINITY_DN3159_c0_g1_i1.p1 TRINITY_DN3159_c0_g1~~TRINITY_DN3159_c0_g1_i1.p1  ORF type:complete len:525 (+),score=95.89 TRINITY_DN3159_c0_g1_i1:88-1575(+)
MNGGTAIYGVEDRNWLSKKNYTFCLLTLLYIIQGVPLGFTMSTMPLLLKAKTSYTTVGFFSISGYPYSLKLFWSPIVDSLWFKNFGRRKSWIIPTQIISGILMLYLSASIDELFQVAEVSVTYLTMAFLTLTLLCATQDIAVDAWGLELFDYEDRHLTSLAQSVGLYTGFFLSGTIFLALNSVEFCNQYLRSVPDVEPLIKIGNYLWFWGVVYIIISVLLIWKEEKFVGSPEHKEISVKEVYIEILQLIKLENMKLLLPVLLLWKIGTMTLQPLFKIRLASNSFPQHLFAIGSGINFPIQLITSLLVSSSLHKPLDMWLIGYIIQIVLSLISMFIISSYTDPLTSSFILILLSFSILETISSSIIFVSQGTFFARISDSRIGGTYLTLLNTITNFGGTWPHFFLFYFVDFFTKEDCLQKGTNIKIAYQCSAAAEQSSSCTMNGGYCSTTVDGFYVVGGFCILFGLVMSRYFKVKFLPLQATNTNNWIVRDIEKII